MIMDFIWACGVKIINYRTKFSINVDGQIIQKVIITVSGILILCAPLLVVAAFVFLLEILASPKKRDGKRMVISNMST